MHHRERGSDVRVGEVEVEALKLAGEDEALVDNPVRGETDDVGVQTLVPGAICDPAPDDVEAEFKGDIIRTALRAIDEELPDDRHDAA